MVSHVYAAGHYRQRFTSNIPWSDDCDNYLSLHAREMTDTLLAEVNKASCILLDFNVTYHLFSMV